MQLDFSWSELWPAHVLRCLTTTRLSSDCPKVSSLRASLLCRSLTRRATAILTTMLSILFASDSTHDHGATAMALLFLARTIVIGLDRILICFAHQAQIMGRFPT